MNKIAFIYPGQGAQKTGMGKDFYEQSKTAREVYDTASCLLNMDMKALCFEEDERLHITEYTQAALVTTCLAMTKVVMEQGLKPDVTAGLSLGEYPAIVTAGGMSLEDAIMTVRKRGILMQSAVPLGTGAMAAILGMTGEAVEEVIQKIKDVTIANYNCPGQIVITGRTDAIKEAMDQLKNNGAKRTVLLQVSGPFHSPMLQEAGRELGSVLEQVTFSELKIPYVTNVTAEYVENIQDTKQLLEEQVASSVKWQQSVEHMIKQGVDTFVEIGPGRTLAGFMKKINREVNIYNIETFEQMNHVIGELIC
ncbi:MAG: ACP S-malonyltransferase [Lachnospiraceae bacterium]